MTKALTLAIAFCSLVFGFSQSSLAQQRQARTPVPVVAAESSNREQDGLEGSVRRVRVETAKMVVKGGNLVEGPRAVRGIATYDPTGRKIDSVDYPVESNTLPGKERYRYDNKGNIVEMVVLGSDGSILSKESYEYEFDQLGNWTKMNSSVAVYENGKLTFEPTEVTYRTISYYYNQAIEKISAAASKLKGVATRSAASPVADSMSHAKSTSQPIATNQPVAEPAAADLKDSAKASVPVAPTQAQSNETIGDDPAATSTEVNTTAANASAPSVVKVAEDVLRSAADPELAASHYKKGAAFLASGRYEEAAVALNQAIRVDPNDANAYKKLAMSYSGMHKNKEAIAGYKKAVQIKKSVLDAPAYYLWAGSYLALRKTSEAISAFKQALYITGAEGIGLEPKPVQSFPSLEQLHHGLGIAYMYGKRFGDSIKEFKEVVTLNPANAEAHYALAVAYLANGDRRAAEKQNKILASLDRELAQKVTAAIGEHVKGRSTKLQVHFYPNRPVM